MRLSLLRKLTCVIAPPGFGKTTLVSEWAASLVEADHACAWVSLDEQDNDPMNFWQYVLTALETICPEMEDHRAWLWQQDWETPGTPSFIAMLNTINDFSEQIVLVLDDYHVINNEAIHDGMDYLLRHLPANLHLIFVSRRDPPLALSRLRAQNAVVDINLDDLKFTTAETRIFLSQIEGVDLDSYQLGRLTSKTDGWITSLVLAIPTIRRLGTRGELDAFIEHFGGDHHYVLDFLTSEVLNQLDADLQSFLLKTSILDELNESLCNAVVGAADSLTSLDTLERANTFVYALNQQRTLYRYHPLFSDVLRLRLAQTYTPSEINQLHLNACYWYSEHGQARLAIPHAYAAQNDELGIRLIRDYLACDASASDNGFWRWFQKLPGETVDKSPDLRLVLAEINLVRGNLRETENQLQQLEQTLQSGSAAALNVDVDAMTRGIAVIRAAVQCVTGDYENGISLAKQILTQLHDSDTLKSLLEYYLILAHQISGDGTLPIESLTHMIQDAYGSKDHTSYLFLQILLATIYKERGQLHLAAQVYGQTISYTTARNLEDDVLNIVTKIGISDIYREWNDLEKSVYYTTQIVEQFLQYESGEPCWLHSTNTCLEIARIFLSQNNLTEAEKFLDIAFERAQKFYLIPDLMHRVDAVRLTYWLAKGDLRKASGWARAKTAPGSQASRQEKGLIARILLAEGHFDQALDLLESVLPQFDNRFNSQSLLDARLLQAVALWKLGDHEASLGRLRDILAAAEPEGWVRTIVETHPDVMPMLMALLQTLQREQRDAAPLPSIDYVEQLISFFSRPVFLEPVEGSSDGVVDMSFEGLTEREQVVLNLLAQGYSSGKIATSLKVSLSTAKTHMRNIYQKLDAHSREYALVRAHDLGLI